MAQLRFINLTDDQVNELKTLLTQLGYEVNELCERQFDLHYQHAFMGTICY